MDHSHHREQNNRKAHEDHAVLKTMRQETRHHDHQAHNVGDFKRRFWVSLIATFPILGLSPIIQWFLGLGDALRFTGDAYVIFVFSSFVFFYGGYPFLKGIASELKAARPGMMTLIALAITTALFSSDSPSPVRASLSPSRGW